MNHQYTDVRKMCLFGVVLCLLAAFVTAAAADSRIPGFTGSNEYMAAAEWDAFVAGYDPDDSILACVDPEALDAIDEKHMQYPVYTQEMADKVDEIAGKYGLALYSDTVPADMDPVAENLIVCEPIEFSDAAELPELRERALSAH